MALPAVIDPRLPPDTESLSLGAGRIRHLTSLFSDIFGLPTEPTQVTARAFAITAQGQVTISQAGATVVADPTVPLGIATKQYADEMIYGVRAVASGVNGYVVTIPAEQAARVNAGNIPIAVGFAQSSTSWCTLSVNGGPAWQIVYPPPQGLGARDILAGQWMWLVFNGSYWTILGGDYLPRTGGTLSGPLTATALGATTGPNSLTGNTYTNALSATSFACMGDLWTGGTLSTSGNFQVNGYSWLYGGASVGGNLNATNLVVGGTLNAYGASAFVGPVTMHGRLNMAGGAIWGDDVITKSYFDSRTGVRGYGAMGVPSVGLPSGGWVYLLGFYMNVTPPFYQLALAYLTGSISLLINVWSGTTIFQYRIDINGAPAYYSATTTFPIGETFQVPVISPAIACGGQYVLCQLWCLFQAAGVTSITVGGPTWMQGQMIGY